MLSAQISFFGRTLVTKQEMSLLCITTTREVDHVSGQACKDPITEGMFTVK
jgi:hypothetical protein